MWAFPLDLIKSSFRVETFFHNPENWLKKMIKMYLLNNEAK